MNLALHFAFALVLTTAIIWFLAPHAARLGLVDEPDQRKRHGEPVPLIGGIAVALAVLNTGLLFDRQDHHLTAFALAAMPMLVLGLLDDRLELRPKHKLVIEVCVALVLVFGGGAVITRLGDLFGTGPIELGLLAVPFTVVCIVGIINAHNMADGVDGLAGSMGLVSTAAFAFVAWTCGCTHELAAALALAGALIGFLCFNLPYAGRPLRVFLGDAGSNFLGIALVLLAIDLAGREGTELPPIGAVWIIGLAILDMGATMLLRLFAGHSPIKPDRRHLHHLLLAHGVAPRTVVLVQTAGAMACAAVGVGGWLLGVPEHWLTYGYLALAAAYLAVVLRAWRALPQGPVAR